MEESLTGLLESSASLIEARAAELLNQLAAPGQARPDPRELAATTTRTLSLPAISADRANLVAEVAIYGALDASSEHFVAGRADAVRYRDGKPEIVFDWKSDVAPRPEDRAAYASQVAQYVRVIGARRGAVVYMTLAEIQWVEPVV